MGNWNESAGQEVLMVRWDRVLSRGTDGSLETSHYQRMRFHWSRRLMDGNGSTYHSKLFEQQTLFECSRFVIPGDQIVFK